MSVLKLSNWSLQKPEQKSRRRRQPRQDKKEAVMTGPTPECTHNAGEQAATKDGQKPTRHRRRSEARRRQAGEQAKARGQNIELANG